MENILEVSDSLENVYNRAELRSTLQRSVVIVEFTKKDGTTRVMKCTTDLSRIPEEYHPKEKVQEEETEFTVEKPVKAENPDLFKIYEIDNGWRSFTYSQVTSWKPV
jgi:hypothetical protein